MRVVSLLLTASCLFAVAIPASAESDPPRRVALFIEPDRARDAQSVSTLANLLVRAVEKRNAVRARFEQVWDRGTLDEARAGLEQVGKDMTSDHGLRRASEHEATLWRTLLGFKRALAAATATEIADVYVRLAATRLAQNKHDAARADLASALNVRPGLSERDFFGDGALKDLFRGVRAAASTRDKAGVRVTSKPKGAEVWVGDKLVGFTPLAVDLPVGTQLIRVRKDGWYGHGWLATVGPGGSEKLHRDLGPLPGRARFEKWLAALGSKRAWRKDGVKAQEAADGIRRLVRAPNLVYARVQKLKDAYRLTGAIATHGQKPSPLRVDVPIDANLLREVDALAETFVP